MNAISADLFVGIDIGTFETKGVVVDSQGGVVARARRPHKMSTPVPGHAEHDAETVWWQGFAEVSLALMAEEAVDPARIRAVGASAIGPCVLACDAELNPLRPGILYGVDARATEQIAELNARLGEEEIVARTGNLLTSQSAGPKILWLKQNEPAVHDGAAYFMTSQSFVVARLTGRVVMDHGTAGYFHPLYNLESKCWDVSGCEDFISADRLPELGWATEVAGTVTEAAALATGLPSGTPVIFGTTDAPAEAISSSVVNPGDMMLMYGSSTYMIEMLDAPVVSDILWSAPFVFEDTYVLAAGTATAGTLTHWLCDVLGLADTADSPAEMFGLLVDLASRSVSGANGLLFLPYFSGERTPHHDPDARGIIAGLTLKHTRADIARAMMEGIGHSISDALKAYEDAGYLPRRILAVGGGTKNDFFLQSVSDLADMEQTVAVTDGAAFGDAALAAYGTGCLSTRQDIAAWCRTGRTVSPEPLSQKQLQADHPDFQELYRQTQNLIHSRATRE